MYYFQTIVAHTDLATDTRIKLFVLFSNDRRSHGFGHGYTD
ncbi:hypothetical protein [Okeania sp. SIO3I5]|nr:hypothetical protein [Okeania sp. SIO3I5]